MDQTAIIEKIKKCLALSKSATASESATAAYMAQKLISRYGIDETLLSNASATPSDEPVMEQYVFKFDGPRVTTWVLNLGTALADVNNCKLWFSGGHNYGRAYIKSAGREADLSVITYMMTYLVQEIEDISKKAAKAFRERHGYAGGKTWTMSFKTGCVSMISERLSAARAQAIADARAAAVDVRDKVTSVEDVSVPGETPVVKYELAVIDNAIEVWGNRKKRAEEWTEKNHKLHTSKSRAANLNGNAWHAGRDAGSRISLNAGPRLKG